MNTCEHSFGRQSATVLLALSTVAGMVLGAEERVTVRFGEQETCKVRNVTTIELNKPTRTHRLRFDLSSLPRHTKVTKAKLKFWVDAAHEKVRRAWGFEVWRDRRGFEGFKVFEGAQAEESKLLAKNFPYSIDTVWLCEFDITSVSYEPVFRFGGNEFELTVSASN